MTLKGTFVRVWFDAKPSGSGAVERVEVHGPDGQWAAWGSSATRAAPIRYELMHVAREAAAAEAPATTGAERIAKERARQLGALGLDARARSASPRGRAGDGGRVLTRRSPRRSYVLDERARSFTLADPFPWGHAQRRTAARRQRAQDECTRDENVRLLEKAGALIAAEIDRLLAAEPDEEG